MGAETVQKSKRDTFVRPLVQIGRYFRNRRRNRAAKAAYLLARVLDPSNQVVKQELNQVRPRAEGLPEKIRFVMLGTAGGLCNASCVHCPTGKASTALSPRNPMPMPIYTRLIDDLFGYGLRVEQVSFGVFGDGLLDPFVVERTKYLRQTLPEVFLSINTNGAAFDAKKHAELNHYDVLISLHCESLDEDAYNDLMRPLRAERVFPKYEEILRTFPGKVRVSVPVSKRNFSELRALREWFLVRGAEDVVFDPLSSRCVEDRSVFDALALAPGPIACRSDILGDLIVDCDGEVLLCCQDFSRKEPIGNLAQTTFVDVFRSARRGQIRDLLDNGGHDKLSTCSKCYADARTEGFPFDHEARLRAEGVCVSDAARARPSPKPLRD